MEESTITLPTPLSEETIRLSALDQQAQRHYAKPLLLFKAQHKGLNDPLIRHLKTGLSAALAETPEFASAVVPIPESTRKELQLRLTPRSGAVWRVVDYTSDELRAEWPYGSFDELAARHFPFDALEIPKEKLVSPLFLNIPDEATELPALGIQVSLIEGGAVVAFCWHHTVSDARGAVVLLNAWARRTRECVVDGKPGEPRSGLCLDDESRERWRLDYGSASPAEVPREYVVDASRRSPVAPGSVHLMDREVPLGKPFRITTWYFPAEGLKALREMIGGQFTVVEMVCSLLWKCVSRARGLLDDDNKAGTSLFTTRLEFRSRLNPPLPGSFIGNICEPNARARLSLAKVCSAPTGESLAALASAIRAATEAVDEAAVRGYISHIHSLPAVTDLTWDYKGFPGPDFGVTDLSGLDLFKMDWGPTLGKPVGLRFAYREGGLVYLLPMDPDGGMEVQVLCEPEAVEVMKGDEFLGLYCSLRA